MGLGKSYLGDFDYGGGLPKPMTSVDFTMPDNLFGAKPASVPGNGFGLGALSTILQNQAKRDQQGRETKLNAETMRYSPWTGLAGSAFAGQNQNMKFNPSLDLQEGFQRELGNAARQAEANGTSGTQNLGSFASILKLMGGGI